MERIKKLNIEQLLSQDRYIIPIYQRNYAWGDSQIQDLLTDIINAYKRKREQNCHYYIGSLVVYLRSDGAFEVIDGQQRLTTFTLIKAYLVKAGLAQDFKPNISFEYRDDSNKALNNPQDASEYFKDAISSIQKHFKELTDKDNQSEVIKYLLQNVQVIRTEVPPKTNLNHYFEIMNTRGEQLEKHEVLKARLMSLLNELESKNKKALSKAAFANIWNACCDMSRYVVLGFDSKIRGSIFGAKWQQLKPSDFDEIAKNFKQTAKKDDAAKSMLDIISKAQTSTKNESKEKNSSERFNSVIDFPNFLLHVLRIFFEDDLNKAREIQLDEKMLLDSFDIKNFKLNDIKNFSYLLLKCRYLFDRYVIKIDTSRADDDHWSLLTIHPDKNSGYSYKNSFGKDQSKIVMLLSMFHVSHPSRIYKNWLYAVLRWLCKNNISDEKYTHFLEDLSDRYYFMHYGKGADFFELITEKKLKISATSISDEILNQGTNVPNFIFNRLDYLLWKNKMGEYKNFRFTFRSSVEHFYPQNPINGEKLKDVLNNFGNLCLISRSMNSKFSNNMPEAKINISSTEQILSLKLSIMMDNKNWCNGKWDKDSILKHCENMLKILNQKAT